MVFQKMVFQKNGFPKYGFSIKKRFLNQKMENYIFSILWLNKIFSNSWKSIPGTTQILEKMRIYHKMDKSICFQKSGKLKFSQSIILWYSSRGSQSFYGFHLVVLNHFMVLISWFPFYDNTPLEKHFGFI